MKESNIYVPLWSKYKPVITNKLKEALHTPQEYQLSKHEFEVIGDRTTSGYAFNLVIQNGHLTNNIDGTAVARDLLEVLKNSPSIKEFLKDKNVQINLTKEFKLKIQTIQQAQNDSN